MSPTSAPRVPETAGAAPTARDRNLGLDAARGLAVVAMVVAHALPFISDRIGPTATFLLAQVNDLASPLFALVMGVAAGLVFPRSSVGRAVARAVVRGAALIALGVALEQFSHWVAVILHILGLLLIVGTPLLVLGSRWLVALAAVLVAVGPWVIETVSTRAGGTAGFGAESGWGSNPLVQWLVLNSHYRVLNLLPLFLLGAVLARRGLDDERTAWWTLMGGLALLWTSFALDLLGHPVVFSGDHTDQFQENGLALTAYGLIMVTAAAGDVRTGAAAVLGPLARVGQVALSLYVFHVLLLVPFVPQFPERGWVPFVVFVVVSIAVAWAWARFVGRGPVEWVIDRISPRRMPEPRGVGV